MIKYLYDTNDRYELVNNGYKNDFYDMDDNVLLETFTDTLPHAIWYLQCKYKIRLIATN